MRLLFVHNRYRIRSGEDVVFDAEVGLLRRHGHEVTTYIRDNRDIRGGAGLQLGLRTVWSRPDYRKLLGVIDEVHPEIVHVHNSFPLISPAVYYAAEKKGVPVVQTLHNFRLLCPAATLYRDGKICEDCIGKTVPWNGTLHSCYRGSKAASGALTAMLSVHNSLKTWQKRVGMYFALSESMREKVVEGGLPAEKVEVKPNFVHPDPEYGQGSGKFALFVGRLAREKGLFTLIEAWKKIGNKLPLWIVGDGELSGWLNNRLKDMTGVRYLGRQEQPETISLLRDAAMLMFPSEWYECMPLVILEAFAVGTPVIATRLGSMQNMIEHGRSGLLVDPGDAEDLAEKVQWVMFNRDPSKRIAKVAHREFELKYTADSNHEQFMNLYHKLLDA